MRFESGRTALVALLFLGAQVGPGLHEILEAGHHVVDCCTDSQPATHFDGCSADHDAPECPVCSTGRTQAAVDAAIVSSAMERVELPRLPVLEFIVDDPLQVDTPDSRGPPA